MISALGVLSDLLLYPCCSAQSLKHSKCSVMVAELDDVKFPIFFNNFPYLHYFSSQDNLIYNELIHTKGSMIPKK
jgi:hypothetical protein